jgi:hypothetical protein
MKAAAGLRPHHAALIHIFGNVCRVGGNGLTLTDCTPSLLELPHI